jgi:hypothetical protein
MDAAGPAGAGPSRRARERGGPGPLARASLALAAAAGAACTLLPPQPDPTRFFVLEAQASPAASASELSLGVGPVTLAAYANRPELVTRAGPTEVVPSPIDRWGEPVDQAIVRVLARDLALELGTLDVILHPWYGEQRPAVQVRVDVHRFERDADGAAVLAARYEVAELRAGGRRIVRDLELRRPAASLDPAAAVAALSGALADLASEIAAGVRSLAGG